LKMEAEIVKIVTGTFSNDESIRTQAEDALGRLDKEQNFPIGLLQIGLNEECEVSVRQSCSVLLKNWIECHWSTASEKFKDPQASDETKAMLRQNIPNGLQITSRPIRSLLSAALANIASWDWPEVWPELIPNLLQALDSDNVNTVDGALRTLREFSSDVTDTHAPEMLTQILPRLLHVMINPSSHPISISRSLQILTTLTDICGDTKMNTLDGHFENILSVFAQCIQKPLNVDEDWAVKRDTFKCLTQLSLAYPKQVVKNCQACFEQCWLFIQNLSTEYYNRAIATENIEAIEDSDGETGGIEGVITSLLDFVTQIFEIKSFKKLVESGLPPLIPSVMTFLQPSASQIEQWNDDPDKFVEDEDDDGFTSSIRTSALDLLLYVAKDFLQILLPPLLQYVSEASKPNASWQQKESAYYIIGSISEGFDEEIMSKFNIEHYLETTVLPDLTKVTNPFLLGRSLWFAGRFTDKIKPELTQQFLEATVTGLNPQQNVIVRIQASRAIFEFSVKIPENTQHLLKPYMSRILSNLIDLASKSSDESLCLILEVLGACIEVDEDTSAQFAPQISDLILAMLTNKSNDPQISSIAEELVENVAKLPSASSILCGKLVPFLVQSLNQSEEVLNDPSDTSINNTFLATCLDITTRLVRSIQKPVSQEFINALYPLVIDKTLKSNDTQIIQSGGETVRGFFAACGDVICSMEGGLEAAEKVILHLLAPDQPEFSASFAGRLVTLIVLNAKSSNIQNILQAVLVKLNTVKTLTVQQSLLLVFARLAVADTPGLLTFLNSTNATQPLLQLWLEKQTDVFGAYERRVTVAGLCKLIELGCNGDETMKSLQYSKKIEPTSSGRQTRSKTKGKEEFVQVPWLSHAMMILTTEWAGQKERDAQNDEDYEDEDDEDYDEEYDGGKVEELNLGGESVGILLSDLLNCRDLEDLEGEEEEDVKNDPIHDIDICDYISSSIRSVSNTQIAQELASGLDDMTKKILTNVVKVE